LKINGYTDLFTPSSKDDLYRIPVPKLNSEFQDEVEKVFLDLFKQQREAKALFAKAETLLLDTLGLANFSPSTEKFNIKSFKDSFAATGRLDAEYFFPAKESALDFLEAMPGQTIGDLFISVRELWQPEKAATDEQVRNYDLTDALSPFLDSTKELSTNETISSTKKRLQAGDLVVSRLRSYLKEIAVVMDGSEAPMVGSTEFIVLRPKQKLLSVETLLVYLRSTLPQLILKWSQDGSNHPRFDEKELLNLRIPDAILAHETEGKNLVERAIAARRRSQDLLEVAKHAVEIAIEQDENAGMAYISENS
jgi:type I restriction enzyme, S subunit